MVLQGLHIPNKPQTISLLREMAEMDSQISDRTWQNWFSAQPPFPQPSKIQCLDQYMTKMIKRTEPERANRICERMQNGYFNELIHGGLMSRLLSATESTDVVHTLRRRAQEYQPVSPLHLHFDAMDTAGWHEDYCGVPWSMVAAIAADRILQLLDDRWSPRSGSIYPRFSSDLSLKWAVADEQQRKEIRRSLAKMSPDPFEQWMNSGASPDWRRLGVSPDIPHEHVFKLLFALAADPSFLVEDRLQVWVLDLATSALAMHAIAWTNRYNTMAVGMPPELRYWVAFHEILFKPVPLEIDHWSIASLMESWPADWSTESTEVFVRARHTYENLLADLGLDPTEICTAILKIREERPLIYN